MELPIGQKQQLESAALNLMRDKANRRRRINALESPSAKSQTAKMMKWVESADPAKEVAVIRRYPNRKSYLVNSSCYISLANVAFLLRRGFRVQAVSAQNSEYDMTRDLLLATLLTMESVTTEELIERIKRG